MDSLIQLPRELNIYTVGRVREQLLAALSNAGGAEHGLAIDGSAVDTVDGAGVQLLVSLANQAALGQCTVRLGRASATLTGACRMLGLSELLDQTPQAGESA